MFDVWAMLFGCEIELGACTRVVICYTGVWIRLGVSFTSRRVDMTVYIRYYEAM